MRSTWFVFRFVVASSSSAAPNPCEQSHLSRFTQSRCTPSQKVPRKQHLAEWHVLPGRNKDGPENQFCPRFFRPRLRSPRNNKQRAVGNGKPLTRRAAGKQQRGWCPGSLSSPSSTARRTPSPMRRPLLFGVARRTMVSFQLAWLVGWRANGARRAGRER